MHIVGAIAALAVGWSGLAGLALWPQRAGFAYHTAAVAVGMVTAVLIVGNPDNYGGQAGPVDGAFAAMAVPVAAAALAARPWRAIRTTARQPALLVAAALALPGLWYGLEQGLMQRNSWPPAADPHHQAHWYAMSLLALTAVAVVATAAASARGWRIGTAVAGLAALSIGVASLLDAAAASAVSPPWAAAAMAWGFIALGLTTTGQKSQRRSKKAAP